jgi:phosphatidylglycerol:prolipoprotein diacylglycerol transferase
MLPWLVSGGWLELPTYMTMLMLGFAMAAVALGREVRASELPSREVFDVALVVLPAAWIGARLFMLFESPEIYLERPWALLSLRGGWVFYGGFLMVSLMVVLRSRSLGLDPWKVGDVFAPCLPFGMAFGRLGCLGAGCCHGRPADWPLGVEVPWAVRYHRLGHVPEELLAVPLHPSPLYECFLGVLLYLVLRRVRARAAYDGQAIVVLFAGYGAGRFMLEWFRGDLERGFHFGGMLSTSQALGAASVALALGLHLWRTRFASHPG